MVFRPAVESDNGEGEGLLELKLVFLSDSNSLFTLLLSAYVPFRGDAVSVGIFAVDNPANDLIVLVMVADIIMP